MKAVMLYEIDLMNIKNCKCCNKPINISNTDFDAFIAELCNACNRSYNELVFEMLNADL